MTPVPIPQNPYLADKVISQMQQQLKSKLSWLDYSFGRAQRLVERRDNKDYYYPGVYVGSREYVNVLPTEQYGNFSFFQLEDSTKILWQSRTISKITNRFAIIFWFNLSKIYTGDTDRDTERIKEEVLKAFSQILLTEGSFTIDTIYENHNNIYKGYGLNEVDHQHLMHPFGALRLEGEITYTQTC